MQLKCSQAQKCSKDIGKTVHVTNIFMCKENKNNDFIL